VLAHATTPDRTTPDRTTPDRTTTSGIDPRRHAPLRHLGGFRSYPVLARHASEDPAYGRAHVDVGDPNPAC
jgi:hypothetical protein